MAQHDCATNVKAKEGIELLMAINNQQLEILRELRRLATAERVYLDSSPAPDTPLPSQYPRTSPRPGHNTVGVESHLRLVSRSG